jgi:hypothetical protein
MKWKWWTRPDREEIEEAQRRLEAVVEDDKKIAELEKRTKRILRENNFAPTIMRALGVTGR